MITSWLQMEPELQDVLAAFFVERFAKANFYPIRGKLQKEAFVISDHLFHDGKRVYAYLDIGKYKDVFRILSRRAVNTKVWAPKERVEFREVVLALEDDSNFLRTLKRKVTGNEKKFAAATGGVTFTPLAIERFVMEKQRILARVSTEVKRG